MSAASDPDRMACHRLPLIAWKFRTTNRHVIRSPPGEEPSLQPLPFNHRFRVNNGHLER